MCILTIHAIGVKKIDLPIVIALRNSKWSPTLIIGLIDVARYVDKLVKLWHIVRNLQPHCVLLHV